MLLFFATRSDIFPLHHTRLCLHSYTNFILLTPSGMQFIKVTFLEREKIVMFVKG